MGDGFTAAEWAVLAAFWAAVIALACGQPWLAAVAGVALVAAVYAALRQPEGPERAPGDR
jgi:hypothetical protein